MTRIGEVPMLVGMDVVFSVGFVVLVVIFLVAR
jgi:hypothetical protein